MKIDIPNFSCDYLSAIGVCGHIALPNGSVLPDAKTIETKCLFSDEAVWVRLILNGKKDPDSIHLHVDAARDSAFTESNRPKQSADFEDLQAVFEEFYGQPISLFSRARFTLNSSRLGNESVVSLLLGVEHSIGEKKARMSGLTFRVEDGQTEKVVWERLSNPKGDRDLRVSIYAESDSVVSNDYLIDSYKHLESVFCMFLTEPGDE